MTTGADAVGAAEPRASRAIDNARAIVVLMVLAFHSMLAYLEFLPPHPFAFEGDAMLWRAFPIVDSQRWLGFDLFCAWLDVFLMSFFFLISGLFTWPSLNRKGAGAFFLDRALRLGVPFALVVGLLMPVAQYPTYLQSAANPSISEYWREFLELPVWPSGPVWFLWLLLVGDFAAALLYRFLGHRREAIDRLSNFARTNPRLFLIGLLLASAVAYVPLALLFGTSGWFQRGPFALQLCRPAHYAVFFFAGVIIGACGIERGLAAPQGPLARYSRRWIGAALLSFVVWVGLTALTLREGGNGAPLALQIVDDLSFVLACLANAFMALAVSVRFAQWRSPILSSIRTKAYAMYLVHYVFVVWLQYALLGFAWPAVAKAALVFAGTVAMSWIAALALQRIPLAAHILGAGASRTATGRRLLPASGAPRTPTTVSGRRPAAAPGSD